MTTNLTTVLDHPAILLERADMYEAAHDLRNYEANRGVVFAALDKQTLTDLTEAWNKQANMNNMTEDGINDRKVIALLDLAALVQDLLGVAQD